MNLYGALTTMADNPLSYGNNGLTKGFGQLTNPKWPNNNRYDWNINFLSSTAGDFPLEIRLESHQAPNSITGMHKVSSFLI